MILDQLDFNGLVLDTSRRINKGDPVQEIARDLVKDIGDPELSYLIYQAALVRSHFPENIFPDWFPSEVPTSVEGKKG